MRERNRAVFMTLPPSPGSPNPPAPFPTRSYLAREGRDPASALPSPVLGGRKAEAGAVTLPPLAVGRGGGQVQSEVMVVVPSRAICPEIVVPSCAPFIVPESFWCSVPRRIQPVASAISIVPFCSPDRSSLTLTGPNSSGSACGFDLMADCTATCARPWLRPVSLYWVSMTRGKPRVRATCCIQVSPIFTGWLG